MDSVDIPGIPTDCRNLKHSIAVSVFRNVQNHTTWHCKHRIKAVRT